MNSEGYIQTPHRWTPSQLPSGVMTVEVRFRFWLMTVPCTSSVVHFVITGIFVSNWKVVCFHSTTPGDGWNRSEGSFDTSGRILIYKSGRKLALETYLGLWLPKDDMSVRFRNRFGGHEGVVWNTRFGSVTVIFFSNTQDTAVKVTKFRNKDLFIVLVSSG